MQQQRLIVERPNISRHLEKTWYKTDLETNWWLTEFGKQIEFVVFRDPNSIDELLHRHRRKRGEANQGAEWNHNSTVITDNVGPGLKMSAYQKVQMKIFKRCTYKIFITCKRRQYFALSTIGHLLTILQIANQYQ